MEIIVGKNAGFCFGVQRAIDAAYDLLKKDNNDLYSIGPLIHNEIVTKDLKSKGLIEINNNDEIASLKNKRVIIRTHGIEKEVYDLLKSNNNAIVDLTCPFVSKIHKLVKEYSENGFKIIVIGDKDHPEVKGIVSYAKEDIYVVINEEDIRKLKIDRNDKVFIVFQTTTNAENAQKLVDILRELFYNNKLVNTICNATQNRQDEVKILAKTCGVMLIIGSNASSNTRKLYEISKKYCQNTYLLNNIDDAKNIKIEESVKVGVSAGASTPKYLIEEILNNVRNEF
ncbi:MAG: 4-hydroxy-3-methylbut-2-enyl diphosphate reductase [Lachnospiraceae bacterium]|nr:4-hydroxy-3-methylbut-2-enyl diphosphate reductase [Lachnospiraceae bacterium]